MEIRDVVVTNNLHKLMLQECARRTLSSVSGKRFTMKELDAEFEKIFDMSRYSIMAIRQNKYQPKIEDAIRFCEYFGITLNDFFNKNERIE